MKDRSTAVTSIYHKVIAAVVISVVVCLSFILAGNKHAAGMAVVELESVTYPAPDHHLEIVKHPSSVHNLSRLQRAKFRIKDLCQKVVSDFFPPVYLRPGQVSLQCLSPVLSTPRPEYYGFLFRYTPF